MLPPHGAEIENPTNYIARSIIPPIVGKSILPIM